MNISQLLTKLKMFVYSKNETDSLLGGKASSSHTHTKNEITDFPTIPTKTSQLSNDSGFLTSHQSLSDYSTKADTVKSISISGRTITVTPGSGSAYNLTTQDTTYSSLPANGGTSTATAYMNQYDTITYGVNRLQFYNSPTSTTSGAANVANPTNGWYYHLLMSHGNNDGYYGDLAMSFHADTLAFRRIASGTDNGWCYLVKNGRTIVSGYEVYVG